MISLGENLDRFRDMAIIFLFVKEGVYKKLPLKQHSIITSFDLPLLFSPVNVLKKYARKNHGQ